MITEEVRDKQRWWELGHLNTKQALCELLKLLPRNSLAAVQLCVPVLFFPLSLACTLRLAWLGGCCVRLKSFLSKAGDTRQDGSARSSLPCRPWAVAVALLLLPCWRRVWLLSCCSHRNLLSTGGTSCEIWLLALGLNLTGTCWEILYWVEVLRLS